MSKEAHSCPMALVKRFQKSTYGKPDRFYESKAWDPSIWNNYWLILVFDDRYDHLRDDEKDILELKRELFKETWEAMMRQKAGTGMPENVAEAL